jgi:hypothetical protein
MSIELIKIIGDSSRISTESWVPLVVPDQCVRQFGMGTGRVRRVAPEICPNCLVINTLLRIVVEIGE